MKGYLLVEILVSMGVFAIVIFAAIAVFSVSQEASRIGNTKTKAILYQRDYIEKIKNIRRNDWETLINDRYIIIESGGNISLQVTTTGETIDGYTRYLDIEDAYRDVSGGIVDTPGQIDPSTKKITVTVSWEGFRPGQLSESMYITRYLDNLAWIQTTEADFNAGTHTATTTVVNFDGEVILGAGGYGDWCQPNSFVVAELNLPNTGDARRVTAEEGKAFTGTNTFFSGSFVEIDISNDDPPVPTIAGQTSGYETNDLFIDGNYAYIAVDDPFDMYGKDVVIVDLTTNTEVGYFDTNEWTGAFGVYVVGDVGYATAGARIYSFDLTSKIGQRPALDSQRLGTGWFWWLANARRFKVIGNYAYVALNWSSYELRLINVSDPNNLSRGARANVNGSDGREVSVNDSGTRVYLATGSSGSKDELFLINTDVPPADKNNIGYNLSIISSYNANGMNPYGIVVVPGNRALLVGTGGEEYQVINTTDENNLVRCGGIDVDSGIYGVSAVLEADGDAYSYIVTGDSNNEFKSIEGGPGGAYSASGVFESQTLDSGYSTAFNRFDATETTPTQQTDITYQIGIVDAGPSGNCSDAVFGDFVFVGPDGTFGTFFDDDDAIPLDDNGSGYENPGQCLRFRSYLKTNDYFLTPTFHDMTINYSP